MRCILVLLAVFLLLACSDGKPNPRKRRKQREPASSHIGIQHREWYSKSSREISEGDVEEEWEGYEEDFKDAVKEACGEDTDLHQVIAEHGINVIHIMQSLLCDLHPIECLLKAVLHGLLDADLYDCLLAIQAALVEESLLLSTVDY